jgi:hypothetical protein
MALISMFSILHKFNEFGFLAIMTGAIGFLIGSILTEHTAL